jgi:hypothetical protein
MFYTISNLLPAIAWSLLSGLVLTGGDIVLRMSFADKWTSGFYLTFMIYMLGIFFMMMSFFQQNIAVATVAAVIINAVGYLVVVYFLYGDTISMPQLAGIVLGLCAFAILELS